MNINSKHTSVNLESKMSEKHREDGFQRAVKIVMAWTNSYKKNKQHRL